jgi:4-diphosphocytidyl-2-C-methyl-D-erythritol kinase
VSLESDLNIPGNLILKAAELAAAEMRVTGRIAFRLTKRTPMGAGLGGGSSDAAAVLLALPVLAGRPIALARLIELAAELGSDVPFFLLGGAAVGIGRGTELYPLPDGPPQRGVLVTPDLHVSTAEAYRRLGPRLTIGLQENKINSFQSRAWSEAGTGVRNDFESVVFEQFPQLAFLKQRLERWGAEPALMSGSGSAVFGLYRTPGQIRRVLQSLTEERVFPISLISRARYRRMWWSALGEHIKDKLWPPPSRYAP